MNPARVKSDLRLFISQASLVFFASLFLTCITIFHNYEGLTMTEPTRKPYTGSCHCGSVKYIVYLTLPHTPPGAKWKQTDGGKRSQLMYRCNCTTCQKAALMHIRLPSAPDDFLLLSPLNPFEELGDYRCFDKFLRFFFCKTCGVRCFTFYGEGEVVDREVGPSGEKRKVWCAKGEDWKEDENGYLSVNAYSLDANQDGLDLREWTEKKWVWYLDNLTDDTSRLRSYDKPFPGGAY